VNSLVERQEFDAAYSELLALTSVVKEETSVSCIVILDEFDNLENLGVRNPFLCFGKVIMVQKDTMYVVSSSRNQAIRKILSEKLSLLFGNFEIVRVPGFDQDTAAAFTAMKLSGFDIDDALRAFLIAFTEGNPFYLDKIAERIKVLSAEKMSNYAGDETVAQAILDLVYDSNGAIHQYLVTFLLDLLDSKYKDTYLAMLAAIALGRNRSTEIARLLRLKQGESSKLLAHLTELGILFKNGTFYRIEDGMLEFWLRHVYQARRDLLVDGVFDRTALFRDDIMKYIAMFMDESQKDPTSKIAILFGSFSNELVQIGARSIRLPHFTKVDIRRLRDSREAVFASLRGKTWVVQVYSSEVGENDIIEYMRTVKEDQAIKVVNKLIIPLRGIDEMARLLAKELKISIWEAPVVNMLLTFYGKGRSAAL
jgi:hypothetical protein